MSTRLSYFRQLYPNTEGATAVEFAVVAPVFLAFVLAILQISVLAFTAASLNYAVEKGARCAAIRTGCPTPLNYYYAPGAPNFTGPESRSCGIFLSATVLYKLNVLAFQKSITLAAQACFPELKSST
jgi:Flp pilus assembly pilin Flp